MTALLARLDVSGSRRAGTGPHAEAFVDALKRLRDLPAVGCLDSASQNR